ncbi:MAG: iron complex outermembrane receptor protein [Halioglobus sp.]
MSHPISPRKNAIARVVSQHRTALLVGATATALLAPGHTWAQTLEEVIVTAQKRESNLQDTPISVQVLGNQRLSELNIQGFDDYVQFLPTVSFQSSRPGISQIYMRGISSGGDGNHSASMPSVGVYLDEQPITTINEILDIHAYDIARIETLSGPQGTLFGASSQAGTLRIITNPPVIGEFQAGYDVAVNSVKDGEEGYTGEGYVNIPIGDTAALRVVGWHDKAGGYIDNVPSTITFGASGITVDNDDQVEKDFNDVETTGMRAKLKIDLNDNWTVTPGIIYQEQDTNGVFHHDPEDIGDLETSEFFDTFYDEQWYQASLTVKGQIGNMELVYAGAYLDRDRDSQYDYTGYSIYLEDLYAGYGYSCYAYAASGDCADSSQYVIQDENWNRESHELRLQSSQDQRLRFIVGLFYQDSQHDFDLQYTMPDMDPANSLIEGGIAVWQTKQIRNDQDQAIFGEVSFDLTDDFTVLVGARYYEYENELYGFNGFIGHCTGFYNDDGKFVEDRENGTPQYPCFDTRILDDVKENDDVIGKVNLTYTIDDTKMVYFTWSEGYRAGGVNRARVEGIPSYEEDFTTNWELGWKTSWLDNRLIFNGAIYYVDWEDFQFSILDFEVSNLTIIRNAGQATIKGLEFDTEFAATENLTLSFSGAYTDAQLEEDIVTDGNLLAPDGTEMPYVPEYQFSTIARYKTSFETFDAYAQVAWSYTDDSQSSLEVDIRETQDSYNLVNLSAGISRDNWNINLFVDNATDERAEISRTRFSYPSEKDSYIDTIRPRQIGIRFGQSF